MLLHNINTDEIKKNNTITKLLWYKCLLMRYIIKFWESGWQGVLLVVFMTRRVVFVKMRCVYTAGFRIRQVWSETNIPHKLK
jgi:hypothetical protein